MEQLVARRAHNPKVAGSSPAPATKDSRKTLLINGLRLLYLIPLAERLADHYNYECHSHYGLFTTGQFLLIPLYLFYCWHLALAALMAFR